MGAWASVVAPLLKEHIKQNPGGIMIPKKLKDDIESFMIMSNNDLL